MAGTRSHSQEKGSSSPVWMLYILGTGSVTISSFFALSWPAFLSKISRSPNSPESPGEEAGKRLVGDRCRPSRSGPSALRARPLPRPLSGCSGGCLRILGPHGGGWSEFECAAVLGVWRLLGPSHVRGHHLVWIFLTPLLTTGNGWDRRDFSVVMSCQEGRKERRGKSKSK